jgi:hypothetical protein
MNLDFLFLAGRRSFVKRIVNSKPVSPHSPPSQNRCRFAPRVSPSLIVHQKLYHGSENSNEHVDSLIRLGLILRTIAQTDIVQSNSLIEALFLALKHRWLFLQSLDTLEQVIRYAEKYLLDHNNLIPRVALRGAPPREMFLGKWTTDDDLKLLQHSEHARQQRKVVNLSFSCGACPV